MIFKEKVMRYINSSKKPLSKEEIAKAFNLRGRDLELLLEVLRDLQTDGLLMRDSKKRYLPQDNGNVFEGIVDMAEAGFAFILVEGRDDDIFVPKENLATAMDSDRVLVELIEEADDQRRAVGKVRKILERNLKKLVGVLQMNKGFGFVIADNNSIKQDIFIGGNYINGAKDGQKVLVEIIKYPEADKNPEGKIIQILGYPEDDGIDVLSVALDRGIRLEFPEKVIKEANTMPHYVTQKDMEGRLDLRDQIIFTIDGADAKDLDDAISIELLDNGNYLLGVHIADVAHYVKENSPLDKEARERGNSIYLIDRVVPMLPPQLSNGICSLNPGEDRLTMSVIMEINKQGNVVQADIRESVINSKERLVYEDVSDFLENEDTQAKKRLGSASESLLIMNDLKKILRKKRYDRGAIDFDFDEAQIIVDERGRVQDIRIVDRRVANEIIEEFMIVTNETVSERYYWLELPFLYRIHEYPDQEKISEFLTFIREFGYGVKGSQTEIHPKELQQIIEEIEGKEEEAVISRMMLRSLKKAKYSEENEIHFGLSSKYYSHFTAPIRRYPDLQIHRIIKEHLNGELSSSRIEHYEKILPDVAEHSSETEREADEAERDVEKIKKAEYMEQYVGEEFTGIISGITSFGIFVELPNTVEGLIHYSNIDDYLIYDSERMKAVSESTGKEYKLGMKVDIVVAFVDKTVGVIDFIFA